MIWEPVRYLLFEFDKINWFGRLMKVLHAYNLGLPVVWKGYMWSGVEVSRLSHLTKWHLCGGIGVVLLLIGVAYAKGWGWVLRELYSSTLYGRLASLVTSFFPCLVFLVFCLDWIKSFLWFWRGISVGKKRSNVIMSLCVCAQTYKEGAFGYLLNFVFLVWLEEGTWEPFFM